MMVDRVPEQLRFLVAKVGISHASGERRRFAGDIPAVQLES